MSAAGGPGANVSSHDELHSLRLEVERIRTRTLYNMVNEITVTTPAGVRTTNCVWLTSTQCQLFTEDMLGKLLSALEIKRSPNLVIFVRPSVYCKAMVKNAGHQFITRVKFGVRQYDIELLDGSGSVQGPSQSGARIRSKGAAKSNFQVMSKSMMCVSDVDVESDDGWACDSDCDEDWSMDLMALPAGAPPQMAAAACAASLGAAPTAYRGATRSRGAPPRPRVGTANAARVSRGSMVDKVDRTVKIVKPQRDASQHVTVTVVIYNTVAGGVPSAEDVKAAVDDMEALYASCGWTGRLASDGASFVKKELTVKNAQDIADKLVHQPYVPPPASNLVVGGDLFPTSSGAA